MEEIMSSKKANDLFKELYGHVSFGEMLSSIRYSEGATQKNFAKKLKISPDTVRNRIKNLEKKEIIVGYKLGLNLEKLDYVSYRVDLQLTSTERNKELFEYCKNHLYIFQIDKTIGTTDFEIEIYARSKEHFKETMQELQDKFNTSLKNYTYFTLGKTYKETFFPA